MLNSQIEQTEVKSARERYDLSQMNLVKKTDIKLYYELNAQSRREISVLDEFNI